MAAIAKGFGLGGSTATETHFLAAPFPSCFFTNQVIITLYQKRCVIKQFNGKLAARSVHRFGEQAFRIVGGTGFKPVLNM